MIKKYDSEKDFASISWNTKRMADLLEELVEVKKLELLIISKNSEINPYATEFLKEKLSEYKKDMDLE